MTCDDCNHKSVCYRTDSVSPSYADKCGDFGSEKTGHWIKDDITERSKSAYKHKCDRCGAYHRAMYDYCPSCGAKMVEPQERSGEE